MTSYVIIAQTFQFVNLFFQKTQQIAVLFLKHSYGAACPHVHLRRKKRVPDGVYNRQEIKKQFAPSRNIPRRRKRNISKAKLRIKDFFCGGDGGIIRHWKVFDFSAQ